MSEVDQPGPGYNDLLIRIHKTAICGTDMHSYHWDEWSQKTIPVPMVVGHEYAGEVIEIGQEVRGFAVGDRVSGEGRGVDRRSLVLVGRSLGGVALIKFPGGFELL